MIRNLSKTMKKLVILVAFVLFLSATLAIITQGPPAKRYDSIDDIGYLYVNDLELFTDACEVFAHNDDFWAHIAQKNPQPIFQKLSRDYEKFFSPSEWTTLQTFFEKTGPHAVCMIPYGDPETIGVGAIVGVGYRLDVSREEKEAGLPSTYSLYYVSSYGNLRDDPEGQEKALSQLMLYFQHGVPKKIGDWWYEVAW